MDKKILTIAEKFMIEEITVLRDTKGRFEQNIKDQEGSYIKNEQEIKEYNESIEKLRSIKKDFEQGGNFEKEIGNLDKLINELLEKIERNNKYMGSAMKTKENIENKLVEVNDKINKLQSINKSHFDKEIEEVEKEELY